jgi:two-component sensor histidine kinase
MGGLSVGTVREAHRWPDELVARLRLLADVFAHTLARQRAEHTATERTTQIQTLAGRLITAQEEERRRIARELHDGVNQKLTALSIALTTLGRRAPSGPVDLVGELARLQERAAGVVQEIRHLSHELHPGVLEHIGLVAALDGYCEEFEDAHGVGVAFRADQDLGAVPIDLALCLYRATQEALGNVAKHAKARQVRVSVARDGGDVVLAVVDDGCGFDLTEPRRRRGLGLVSLEERIRRYLGEDLDPRARSRRPARPETLASDSAARGRALIGRRWIVVKGGRDATARGLARGSDAGGRVRHPQADGDPPLAERCRQHSARTRGRERLGLHQLLSREAGRPSRERPGVRGPDAEPRRLRRLPPGAPPG